MLPRLPDAIINEAAANRATLQATSAGTGAVLPLIYGRQRVGGLLFAIGILNGDLVFGAAWCIGPVYQIESITINDEAVPSGVTVTSYQGTTTQGVNSTLAAAVSGYSDKMVAQVGGYQVPVCYSVFRVPPGKVAGFPRVAAVIKGAYLYDPRLNASPWSDNPALALADWLVRPSYGQGVSVDWDSVEDAAFACEQTLTDGSKRRTINLALDAQLPVAQWTDVLRTYAGCFVVFDGASVRLVPDRPVLIQPMLIVQDGYHRTTADALTVTKTEPGALVVHDARHLVTTNPLNLDLVGDFTLFAVDDARHTVASDHLTVSTPDSLVMADAGHAVTSDTVALVNTTYTLIVADCMHSVGSDWPELVYDPGVLVVADAHHAVTSDSPVLPTVEATLQVIPGVGSVDIAAAAIIPGAGGVQVETIETDPGTLVVADARHIVQSDDVAVSPDTIARVAWVKFSVNELVLVVEGAYHAVASDEIPVAPPPVTLVVADCGHAVASDEPTPSTDLFLVVDDALHAHAADEPDIEPSGTDGRIIPGVGATLETGSAVYPGGGVENV